MIAHQAQGLRDRRPGASADRGATSAAEARGRILGIASGKGGVGKSALAVNLALAAAATGASTLLIDGDLGLANADLLMGLVPGFDLGDFAEGRCAFEAAIVAGPGRLELLVVGGRAAAVAALERGLRGAPGEALGARIDARSLTVLDLGAGIGAGVIELARHCEPVWLVATPEPTSLADAYTTAKQLWEREPALQLELVVNRATDRATGERTHRALDRLTRRFLDRPLPLRAILPDDPAMGQAVARQTPVLLDAPNAPIARRIRLLAESIVEERRARRARPPAGIAPGPGL
ncbi:MAG: P-loop NTPase [Deltaproteobacteria bacterium]|nr:P-loop NTPase [Deltaproteobacteria bacterium]